MAQIKNIKKPGDLIRGASVGLAGLDKDGNVIGYKAAAADAGKVLTVGVDGSVAPAEGGGGDKIYWHHVTGYISRTGFNSYVYFDLYTKDNAPFNNTTKLTKYIREKFQLTANYIIPVNGVYSTSDGQTFINGIQVSHFPSYDGTIRAVGFSTIADNNVFAADYAFYVIDDVVAEL